MCVKGMHPDVYCHDVKNADECHSGNKFLKTAGRQKARSQRQRLMHVGRMVIPQHWDRVSRDTTLLSPERMPLLQSTRGSLFRLHQVFVGTLLSCSKLTPLMKNHGKS